MLGMFWQLVQALDEWIVINDLLNPAKTGFFNSPDGLFQWLQINYFLDPFLAALVFGALVRQWRAVYVAVVGLGAGLVIVTGTILTRDAGGGLKTDVQAYIVLTLHWIWILGLIAFGVFIGRKLGDLFDELRPST